MTELYNLYNAAEYQILLLNRDDVNGLFDVGSLELFVVRDS